ncbi:hypothetical protein J6590_031080 [Homalodisca vitripennis]|nr:hypothetical protein J6590_031080 [Homalodisca vitripennis]
MQIVSKHIACSAAIIIYAMAVGGSWQHDKLTPPVMLVLSGTGEAPEVRHPDRTYGLRWAMCCARGVKCGCLDKAKSGLAVSHRLRALEHKVEEATKSFGFRNEHNSSLKFILHARIRNEDVLGVDWNPHRGLARGRNVLAVICRSRSCVPPPPCVSCLGAESGF